MPCRSYDDRDYPYPAPAPTPAAEKRLPKQDETVTRFRDQIDSLTRMLCITLTCTSPDTLAAIVSTNPDIGKWWDKHKKDDARRHAAARADLGKALKILGDLSPEDLEKAKADIAKLKP